MDWDLPTFVTIGDEKYEIEGDCDYRVILDILCTYEDKSIEPNILNIVAFNIFFKNPRQVKDAKEALKQMFRIIDYTTEEEQQIKKNPIMENARLICWSKDFKVIAPAVSRELGYDVRTPNRYTHWWSFLGAMMNLKECLWTNIVNIRYKLAHKKKLEDWEKEFYIRNKDQIEITCDLTEEEKEFLYS